MGAKSFKYVYIPHDVCDPIEQWSLALPEGREVECLLDRLKEHYRQSSHPIADGAKKRQMEALKSHLPAEVQGKVDDAVLDQMAGIVLVETIALLPGNPGNRHVSVNLYLDDKSTIKDLPLNRRASEICHYCGHPAEVRGDAFLARIMDDEENFERLDFGVEEVSSSAQWITDARKYNEQKRQREPPEAMLHRISSNAKAAAKVHELTPAEAAKERGNVAFKSGDFSKAVAEYTELIGLVPDMAVAFSNRSMAYLKLGQFAAAEGDATRALELDGANAKALFRRGCAKEGLGDKEGAIQDFETLLLQDPKNSAAVKKLDTLKAAQASLAS